MKLKVIKYKNYGCTMTGPADSESDWENKFYWSFYELSNGNIINLQHIENWKKNKFVDADFDDSYTKYELKNGETISYEFGDAKANDLDAMSEEFFDWFESSPPYNDIKRPIFSPSIEERKCVIEFYKKHIIDRKDQKTDTIIIAP
tara:strand:+ start:485 stop:922 length:438 start_codon:yes stop_codon:yes gene_type:complete